MAGKPQLAIQSSFCCGKASVSGESGLFQTVFTWMPHLLFWEIEEIAPEARAKPSPSQARCFKPSSLSKASVADGANMPNFILTDWKGG